MIITEPVVHLVAETTIDQVELRRYLGAIGADTFELDDVSAAEGLAEVAGRLCYRSWRANGGRRPARSNQPSASLHDGHH